MVLRRWESITGSLSVSPLSALRSDEGLTMETLAFLTVYDSQFTLSTQLITLNYPIRDGGVY